MIEAMMHSVRRHLWWAGLVAALLSGCGGGGDDPVAREQALARPSYSVGGTITLDTPLTTSSTITLYLFDPTIDQYVEFFPVTGSGGPFTFNRQLFKRDTYNVSVAAAVGGYTCSVASGASGTISRSDVTNVAVSCIARQLVPISVSVSGLAANSTVVIQLGSSTSNQINASANTTYTFPFSQFTGTQYDISIVQQPAVGSCTVPNPSGTVTAGMSAIPVNCTSP